MSKYEVWVRGSTAVVLLEDKNNKAHLIECDRVMRNAILYTGDWKLDHSFEAEDNDAANRLMIEWVETQCSRDDNFTGILVPPFNEDIDELVA